MKNKKTEKQKTPRESSVKRISTVLSPVFVFGFYVCAVLIALCVICAPIIALVNVPVNEMLLPPDMTAEKEEDVTVGYSVNIGNGITVELSADEVELADIKTAIYAQLLSAVIVLAVLIPIFRLLSKLMKNIAADDIFNELNGKYTELTGIIVTVGYTVLLFTSNFCNYLLVRTFAASGTEYSFSPELNLFGVIFGLIIILSGAIYRYCCRIHNSMLKLSVEEAVTTAVEPAEQDSNS